MQSPQPTYRHEKYMDEVSPNIWLGDYQAALDEKTSLLRRHKISHVVSIGAYEKSWTTRKDPKHLIIEVEDSPFIFVTDYFVQAFPFMEEALNHGNGVLVHCEQGRSRSGAIVVAFLMKKTQKQYSETLNKILIHRKKIMPNIGFQIQLRNFGKHRWDTSIQYGDKIDIEKELANALKNLTLQVMKLQTDMNKKERLCVTISDSPTVNTPSSPSRIPDEEEKQSNNENDNNAKKKEKKWQRKVVIGLDENDLNIFRKEWVLLVFLSHQFQLYEIAVHKNTINLLYIIGEMYFPELLLTFKEVFEPTNSALIMDFDNPSQSIALALQAYAQKGKTQAET